MLTSRPYAEFGAVRLLFHILGPTVVFPWLKHIYTPPSSAAELILYGDHVLCNSLEGLALSVSQEQDAEHWGAIAAIFENLPRMCPHLHALRMRDLSCEPEPLPQVVEDSLARALPHVPLSVFELEDIRLSDGLLAALHSFSGHTLETVQLSLGGRLDMPVAHNLFPFLRFLCIDGPIDQCVELIQALHPMGMTRPPLELKLYLTDKDQGWIPRELPKQIRGALGDSLCNLTARYFYREAGFMPYTLGPFLECPNLTRLSILIDTRESTAERKEILDQVVERWPELSSMILGSDDSDTSDSSSGVEASF